VNGDVLSERGRFLAVTSSAGSCRMGAVSREVVARRRCAPVCERLPSALPAMASVACGARSESDEEQRCCGEEVSDMGRRTAALELSRTLL
jgi:hypothetical protein